MIPKKFADRPLMFGTSVVSLSERTSCDHLPVHPAAIVGRRRGSNWCFTQKSSFHKSTLPRVGVNVPRPAVLCASFRIVSHKHVCVRAHWCH